MLRRSIAMFALLLASVGVLLAAEPKDRRTKVLDDKDTFAQNDLWIYNDLPKAFAEAEKTGKPLLVVFRCVPCEACSQFDQHLLEKQEELRDVLEKFVCVRVVYANGLDLSLFDFDFDQSFHAMVLRADREVLARYGTRSHRPEEEDMTVEGFRKTLERVVEFLSEEYFDLTFDVLENRPLKRPFDFKVPDEFPSLTGKYKEKPDYDGKVVQTCIHCHQVRDAERAWYRDQGKKIPDEVLFPQPLPDVIGLRMDPRTAVTVSEVEEHSIAAKADLQAGDEIAFINDRPICSTADLQWALHAVQKKRSKPPRGKGTAAEFEQRLDITYFRPADEGTQALLRKAKGLNYTTEVVQVTIELPNGWRRKGDLSWRPTTWDLRRMATGGMLLETLPDEEREKLGLAEDAGALRAKHVGQYGEHAVAKNAGFVAGDIILSVDGQPCPPRETDFIVQALEKPKGTRLILTVRRGERELEMHFNTQ